jgi:hypothetical protein
MAATSARGGIDLVQIIRLGHRHAQRDAQALKTVRAAPAGAA